jgi:hypothetical protein
VSLQAHSRLTLGGRHHNLWLARNRRLRSHGVDSAARDAT